MGIYKKLVSKNYIRNVMRHLNTIYPLQQLDDENTFDIAIEVVKKI